MKNNIINGQYKSIVGIYLLFLMGFSLSSCSTFQDPFDFVSARKLCAIESEHTSGTLRKPLGSSGNRLIFVVSSKEQYNLLSSGKISIIKKGEPVTESSLGDIDLSDCPRWLKPKNKPNYKAYETMFLVNWDSVLKKGEEYEIRIKLDQQPIGSLTLWHAYFPWYFIGGM